MERQRPSRYLEGLDSVKGRQLRSTLCAMEALKHLAAHHEQRGEYEDACEFVRRQVALEPWYEAAQRRLMRTLALSGQRSTALKQYRVCHRILADELGIEPAKQTTELFEQIRDEKYERPESPRQNRGRKSAAY